MSLEAIVQALGGLALFHTLFNVLGMMPLLPLADRLATLLDDLRATRRLVDQLVKADRLLSRPTPAAGIKAEAGADGERTAGS